MNGITGRVAELVGRGRAAVLDGAAGRRGPVRRVVEGAAW
jgi:hypothetical protein